MTRRSRAGAETNRYTCPQCFTDHYQNDVLFAGRQTPGMCDMRQAAHRYALSSDIAFEQWCRAGVSEILLNWRTLPQDRRRWNGGAIEAVRDVDGNWLSQRVCPCCHMPLSSFCPVVFGWDENGISGKAVSDLLYFAAESAPSRWRIRRESGLPLNYDCLLDTTGEMVLKTPAALENARGSHGENIRRRCCGSASGVVVRLQIRQESDDRLDDTRAFRTLYNLLDSCGYSGGEQKMAAVVLLEGLEGRPDAVEVFKRECTQLARHIQYDFADCCFAAGIWEHPQAAVQAVEWLSGHVARPNAEE